MRSPTWAPTCWRCSMRTRSGPRATAACHSAAWWACGSPRTRPAGSRRWRCARPRRTCRPRSFGGTPRHGAGPTGLRRSPARASRAGSHPATRPASPAAHPGTVAGFVTTLERDVVPEGYAGCCEAIAAMDLRPLLPSVTAPTLVIAGAEDPATPPWHGAVIASSIPGARLRVIRGAAHLANVSAAAEVTAALLAHLAG